MPDDITNPAVPRGRSGICSMAFHEVGRFCEEAFSWGEGWAEKLRVDDQQREQRRHEEAKARLLESATRAQQAGVNVQSILGGGSSGRN